MKQSNKKTIVCVLLCVLFSVISAFALVGCKKTEEPKKTKLDSPVIASKTYTGSNQKATVAENEAYEVTVNEGGINVGDYDVILTLTDTKKYEWTTPDADDKAKVTLKFAITKAGNEITSLTLDDWAYDETANEPTATAKFGTAAFTYSATQDGEYTATVPTAVGKYWVKATVEGTSNYDGAEKTTKFEIAKQANAVQIEVSDIKYGQTPNPTATAAYTPAGETIKCSYALTQDGDYVAWDTIEKRVGDYYVKAEIAGDKNHDGANAVKKFVMNKGDNSIADFTIADITCNQTPVLNATASAGTTVTYKYATAADGTYLDISGVNFVAGKYYIKAYTDGNDNYVGAESNPATLTVTHAYEWKKDAKGNDYRECVCGAKDEFSVKVSKGALEAGENGYTLHLYNSAVGGRTNSVTLAFTVSFAGVDTTNAVFEWAHNPSGIVTVTGDGEYTVTSASVGSTVLTATYTNNEGKKAIIVINVTVERVVENLSVRPAIEVENLTTLTIADLEGEVKSVLLGDVNIMASADGNVITLDKSKLPKTAANMGERELTVVTDLADYKLIADIYTLIISDKAEFDKMRDLARSNGNYSTTGILDGYFVLDSDIEYNGEFESFIHSGTLWKIDNSYDKDGHIGTLGFKGVFDGRGYNVNGLIINAGTESGGIVGAMHDDGIFRNVSFTNATVYENSGYICSMGGGLIENVQIAFVQIGKGNDTVNIDGWSPRAMGAFYTYQPYKTNATVKNCVVDAIDAKIYYKVGTNAATGNQPNLKLGTKAYWENVHNLIVLCNDIQADEILSKSGASAKAKSYSSFKTDESCQAAANALDKDLWTIKSGLPFMRSLADKVDVEVDFVDLTTAVNNGGSIEIKVNSRYAEITVEGYDGITFENGILSVAEDAISGTVRVTVRSVLNDSRKEAEITVRSTQTVEVEHEKILADKDTTELDLSFASNYYTDTATVTYGTTTIVENGTLTGGKLTVNLSGIDKTGDLVFVVTTEKGGIYYSYNVNVLFATKVIRTADDLEVVRVKSKTDSISGLYVLGNDIDMKGVKFSLDYNNLPGYWVNNLGFRGTFDGQNHTISNFTAGQAGLFGHIGAGAVIKDVNFTKVACNNEYLSAIFARGINGAEINNVIVGVIGYTSTANDSGLFAARYTANTKFITVKVDAQTCDVYSIFGDEVLANSYSGVEIKVKSYTQFGNQGADVNAIEKATLPSEVTVTTATTEA